MFVIDIIKLIIPKKDHDIVLKGYLSWFLVPLLLVVLTIFPQYNSTFTILIICIVAISLIESVVFAPLTYITKLYSVVAHLLLFIPIFYRSIFFYINKNSKKNPKKSCLQKNNGERKAKNVRFSNNNKNYYKDDFRHLVRFNNGNFILLIIGILIINYLPYWPYFMPRGLMTTILLIITISLWIYSVYF